MTPEEKTLVAKKRYEEFINKFFSPTPDKGLVRAYLTYRDGTTDEDYYWSDHELTPTSLYRWLRRYNNPTRPKNKHAVTVLLRGRDYESLMTMYEAPEEPLVIEGATIIPNKADF